MLTEDQVGQLRRRLDGGWQAVSAVVRAEALRMAADNEGPKAAEKMAEWAEEAADL